jgi:hypothetical protein
MAHAIVMTPQRVPKAVNAWYKYLVALPDQDDLRDSPVLELVLAFYRQMIEQALRLGVIAVKDDEADGREA